jgi:hypothetical protein
MHQGRGAPRALPGLLHPLLDLGAMPIRTGAHGALPYTILDNCLPKYLRAVSRRIAAQTESRKPNRESVSRARPIDEGRIIHS